MIPLLHGGERIAATRWNTLFEELDAKMTAVLEDRTFLIKTDGGILFNPVDANGAPLVGKLFYFNNGEGERPRSDVIRGSLFGIPSYDHQPFSDAAADEALAVELFDEENKVITFTDPIPDSYRTQVSTPVGARFFDGSLEAHRRMFNPDPEDPESVSELYWLMEPNFYRPERISSYGLAEIICEGLGKMSFEPAWNRYRFFRIHNLSGANLDVEFKTLNGSSHTMTVPAYACRCVRRESADLGYVNGFNYFNRYQPGDPTVFEMPLDNSTPQGSMGANTVIHPAFVYRFIAALFLSPAGASVWRDPHELYDIGELYRSYFAT